MADRSLGDWLTEYGETFGELPTLARYPTEELVIEAMKEALRTGVEIPVEDPMEFLY